MRIMKSALLCGAIAAVLAVAGCGAKEERNAGSPSPSASTEAATPVPTPQVQQQPILSFYSNKDATELVQREVTIEFADEADKYLAALNALKQSPSDDAVSLCPRTSFLSAALADGKLTVDLNLPDEDRLGSGGEGMLLEAYRKLLFQFEEVESFEILVDGAKPESLMGHYDLPEWFTR